LARRGSGSACRSVYTGFVTWSGSFAEQIYEKKHWPELRDVIVIIDAEEKKMSSRDAMKRTVETSDAYKKRLTVVDDRVEVVKQAIGQKDFPLLAKTIMEDSDELHACLKDTRPNVKYLTEKSYKIIEVVRRMNMDQVIVGYTFDAGPNAHLITLEQHVESVVQNIKACIEDVSIIIG
jgi:diphosphomevalonate decarboxylase